MAHPTSSPYTTVRLAAPCSQGLAEGDRSALVWVVSRGIASYEVIATRSIRATLLSTLRRQTGSRDARAPASQGGVISRRAHAEQAPSDCPTGRGAAAASPTLAPPSAARLAAAPGC